jgi:hypothetical protein
MKKLKNRIKELIINNSFVILVIVIGAVMIALVPSIAHYLGSPIDEKINKMKENVGQKVIIKNDTLMIIDYSFLNSNYTLEDGRGISVDLVDKLERANQKTKLR